MHPQSSSVRQYRTYSETAHEPEVMSYNVQRFPARRHRLPAGRQAEPRTAAKVVQQGAVQTGAREASGGGNRIVMRWRIHAWSWGDTHTVHAPH